MNHLHADDNPPPEFADSINTSSRCHLCEQASNPDPTHFGLQCVDLACEIGCLAGSQPAPVVTPPFLHFYVIDQ